MQYLNIITSFPMFITAMTGAMTSLFVNVRNLSLPPSARTENVAKRLRRLFKRVSPRLAVDTVPQLQEYLAKRKHTMF